MKRICQLIIFFTALFLQDAIGQTDLAKAQTIFLYNFTRLTQWPASYRTGPFIIGVLGNSEVFRELTDYSKGKKVGAQDIVIRQVKDADDIGLCHILFIGINRTRNLPEVLTALSEKSTMIVTERGGAINQGAAINFVIIHDKLRFEISPENASKYGIRFSSKLSEMAFKVH